MSGPVRTPEQIFEMLKGMNHSLSKVYERCMMCDTPTQLIWNGSRLCLSCQEKYGVKEKYA